MSSFSFPLNKYASKPCLRVWPIIAAFLLWILFIRLLFSSLQNTSSLIFPADLKHSSPAPSFKRYKPFLFWLSYRHWVKNSSCSLLNAIVDVSHPYIATLHTYVLSNLFLTVRSIFMDVKKFLFLLNAMFACIILLWMFPLQVPS